MTRTTRTIRPVRLPEDAVALADVWRAAVEATHAFLTPADVDHYYPRIRDEFLPALRVLAAVDDADRPIGFIGTDEHRIEMLFVDPAQHGRGVGTQLIEAAMGNLDVIEVDVNEQNPSATQFYLARGFQQIGRSALDGDGRPFPLLHLRRVSTER